MTKIRLTKTILQLPAYDLDKGQVHILVPRPSHMVNSPARYFISVKCKVIPIMDFEAEPIFE